MYGKKIKSDSGSICKYENLKLCLFCEIYLMMHGLYFSDRVPSEKKINVVGNSF